jgi:hypothetical protein
MISSISDTAAESPADLHVSDASESNTNASLVDHAEAAVELSAQPLIL